MSDFNLDKLIEVDKRTKPIENISTGDPKQFSIDNFIQKEKDKIKGEYSSYSQDDISILQGSANVRGMSIKGASEMFRLLGDNWIPVDGNSTADYQNSLAANQSTSEFMSNLGSRFISNFGSGIVSSFDYDLENMWNLANGKSIEHTSELFDYAKKIREDAQIENPLYYNTNMEFGSRDYFAQIPDALGYSFGRMVGDIGQQVGLSLLTAATFGASSGLQASVLATKLAKYSTGLAFGAFKGLQETKDNALETRENVYNEYRSMGVSHDEAQKYANEAAHLHFKMEAIPLVALNALQFGMIKTHLPGKGEMPQIGSYSNVVESLGKAATKGIKNNALSSTARFGIQMASEGFEEGMQSYFGKKAEDEIMRSSGHRGMFVDFNPMDQEMGIAIISGALGGGIFSGLGSVASSIGKKFTGNINGKLYDDLVNNTTSNIIKYNTALNKAVNEGKTEESANIRFKMSKQMVYDNLHWDLKQGDERAFNTYLSTLIEAYEALEKNDAKALEKFQLQNTPDNKQYFKDLIEDAISIKEKFQKSYAKYEDVGVANNISQAEFEMEKAVQTKKRATQEFNKEVEAEYQRQDVSSQRVKDFNMKMGELNFLASKNRTEVEQKRYEQLDQEIKELEEVEWSQAELIEMQNTDSIIEGYQQLHKALEQQDKRFEEGKKIKEKLESFAGRKDYLKKRKEKELEEKKKRGNIKDVEIVVNSKDTAPEIKEKGQAIVDNMKAEQAINQQSPNIPKTAPNPPQIVSDALTDTDGGMVSEELDALLGYTKKGNKTIPDSGATFKSPKTLRELTDEQKEALKGGIKRIVDTIKVSKGETPNFKKLVKILVDTYGKAYVDERFEAFALAYDLQYGLKESDKTDAYMIYIQGLEGAVESFDNLLSGVFVEERSDEVLEKTASVTPAQKVTTSNIKIDKTIVKNTIDNEGKVSSFKDDRLTDSGLKGAYLSLPYTLKVEERDGKFYVTRTTKTDAPLENSENLNSTYVLDPNNLKPGTKLSVRIPDNVQNLLVSYWEDLQIDENGIKTLSQPAKFMNKKLMTFGEWERIPGNQKIINGKLNPRWVAKVPMIASTGGNNVFYIHDNEWYSQNTISDFANPVTGIPDYNKQRQTIEAARENLLKVRMEAFQNNGTEITITEKGWGAYTDLSGGTIKGVLTLSDAFKGNTDQAMVGMVKGGRVFINQGGRIVDLESAFPDATIKTMDFGSGSMVDIRQGSTPNTLQVFPLFRNILSEESATNVENILRAILGQIGSQQSTIEKIEELTGVKVANPIGNINHRAVVEILSKYIRIGINKDIASAGTPYVEYFETGDYIQFGKFGENPTTLNLNNKNTNVGEFMSFLSSNKIFQNFAVKDFSKEKRNMMFTIDNNGNLTPNGFYGDYVKTQLKTNIATYNIGTEDQPNYITFTQPRVGFTHGGIVEQQPVMEEQISATETVQADAQNGIDVSEAEVLPPSPASVIISNIEGIKVEAEELGVSIEDPYLDAIFEKAKAEEEAQRIALLDKQLAPIRATIDILTEKGFLIPC